MKNILVAAGGTGGHLFPALAVVETLKKKLNDEIDFTFYGCSDKIEGRVVPELGYKFYETDLHGVSNFMSLKGLQLPFKIFSNIIKIKKFIKENNVDAVLCAGAYLSVPPGIAAKQLDKKLFLMESNVNIGKANKFLLDRCDMIFTSFAKTSDSFPDYIKDKVRLTGNPIRHSLLESREKEESRKKFGLDINKKTILIFGGSLGAKTINNSVIKNIDNFAKKDYQIIWQCGNIHSFSVELPSNIKLLKFIDDMGSAYSAADLVVSRSGATSAAEICALGKPSILVPLPSASNNEQYLNAQEMDKSGAAVLVKNEDIEGRLYDLIEELINNNEKLNAMSQKALSLGNPKASEEIADTIIKQLMN